MRPNPPRANLTNMAIGILEIDALPTPLRPIHAGNDLDADGLQMSIPLLNVLRSRHSEAEMLSELGPLVSGHIFLSLRSMAGDDSIRRNDVLGASASLEEEEGCIP